MWKAVNPLSSLRTPQRPAPARKIGAITDGHASMKYLGWISKIEHNVDYIVDCGDKIDRGKYPLEVLEKSIQLSSQKKLVPLLGNHEALFICAMAGDLRSYVDWARNGGWKTLAGFDVPLRHRIMYKPVLFNERLRYYATWITDNFKLFHIDEFGALYIHAGVPMNPDGSSALEYRGLKGLAALEVIENEFRSAVQRQDIRHDVINLVQGNNNSLLWDRSWIETLVQVGEKRLLDDLGVKMLVFGHEPLLKVLNVENKVYGIDLRMNNDQGGVLINEEKQVTLDTYYSSVAEEDFAGLGIDTSELWKELIGRGYIYPFGVIKQAFIDLSREEDMRLSGGLAAKRTDIFSVLRQAGLNKVRTYQK